MIDHALQSRQPITFRFVRRLRKGKPIWYVHATTDRPAVKPATDRRKGCLGVDLNVGHVACGLVDRHGNPVLTEHFSVRMLGRRREQLSAALGEVTARVVALAKQHGVPIATEHLDFESKKDELEVLGGKRYARKLSGFAYALLFRLLVARAYREGVEVIEVNPAFTTVIGYAKFGVGYGLSPHAAAAVAIARRALGFGERLRARLRSALPLPARNRGRHVWGDWGRLNRWLVKQGGLRLLLGRCPSEGGPGRGRPPSAAAPEGPPRDGGSGTGMRLPGASQEHRSPGGVVVQ